MSKNKQGANGKHDTLHVGLLIDESGSMGPMHGAVIGGTNEFVAKLAADQNGTKVLATLAMFDLHGGDPVVRTKFKAIPVAEVGTLGPEDYSPRGATPLNDAVIKTIRTMDKRVKKGDRAMLVILTDGLENASESSSRDVRKLIVAREKRGWEFIYLGRQPGRLGGVGPDRPRRSAASRSTTRPRRRARGRRCGRRARGRRSSATSRTSTAPSSRTSTPGSSPATRTSRGGDDDRRRAEWRRPRGGRVPRVAAAAIRDAIEALERERPDLAERLRELLGRIEAPPEEGGG